MIFYKRFPWFHRRPERAPVLESLQPRLDLSTSLLGKEMVPDQRRHASHRQLGDKSISSGEQLGKPKLSKVIRNQAPRFAQNQANKSARPKVTEWFLTYFQTVIA